ncbi:MAG: YbaB/EbfC family nucleoid-associated protein, partial [Candidatus Omnitrophica bacterium]|nr:YbaB/EbfC family nucleoid-associated protein [Candidatus Omnitrophota bacterium]
MFDKMKGLMEMQRKMEAVKKELESTNFDIQSPDGSVKITMNGTQEVKEVVIKDDPDAAAKASLENSLKDTFNRAIKRSQEIGAQKMKNVVGFNLPGLT